MLKYITDKFEKLNLNKTDFKGINDVYTKVTKHYCFKYKSVYHLIIHGDLDTNKVDYDGQMVSFAELPKLIRKEKNIPDNEDIVIKVYTCYGGNMPYYIDSKNLVVSAFANFTELFFKPFLNSFEFSYA